MIEINNISFSYPKKQVLSDISLKLEEGRIYGLLGENGVGKTTLLSLLCGLKKPAQGTITIDGENPFSRKPSLLSEIYYLPDEVPQFNMSAREYASNTGKFWSHFSKDDFAGLMSLFDVDPEQHMNKMSAGQLKKACISFALACHTKYLFLDEPTNGLDIPSKAQFRKAVTSFVAEDATLVISTHQVRDLENIIDPIVILDNKSVLLNATIEEISNKLYFDYSGTPAEDALYSERTIAGGITVVPNKDGLESKVNIEALFNAVLGNKTSVKNLFK